jgi:hypothetical protein
MNRHDHPALSDAPPQENGLPSCAEKIFSVGIIFMVVRRRRANPLRLPMIEKIIFTEE